MLGRLRERRFRASQSELLRKHAQWQVLVGAILASNVAAAGPVKITATGRLHLDYAYHKSDVAQFDNRAMVRRAQFGVEAKYRHNWSAKVVYDLASGGSLKDSYLRYSGWTYATIIVGQYKVPFGLEQLSSTNDLTFIERSLASEAFTLSRRKGIGFETQSGHHTFSAMRFTSSIGGGGGQGVAARFTYAPVDDDETVVHFGLAATAERPTGAVNLGARPESLPTDPRLVKTGNLQGFTRVSQLGVEAAWQDGPLSLQAEWMDSYLSPGPGAPDANFKGWYVAGSWILTGESRDYHEGVFKDITSDRPAGAWEIAMRFSRLDLDHGLVLGGKEDNLTLGVNWYFRDYARVMANYIKVKSDRRGISDNPTIAAVRVQFAF